VIVSVKYILLVMRLDNRGEGGILALLALLLQTRGRRWIYVALGLFGAALLYGEGIITPAISVLSATEGLGVATPAFTPFVLPSTLAILFGLFVLQRYGTARVGVIFGPIMLVWFATIGVLGAVEIARAPAILRALNPWYGVRFFAEHGLGGFLVLGAVVLAITGVEALYADMGHFGRTPIRLVWFALVLPALLLNYFGQGALVLREPTAAENPFYLLAPAWFLFPLIAIATLAAIVASQALISGAFSLTQQSVQLGYSPRVTIVHTSRSAVGQIYIPEVNVALMIGCLVLVIAFQSSSALGAAYGVAVTGTMAITTVLFYVIAVHRWGWSVPKAGVVAGLFLLIDLAFLSANLVKIAHGGWVPLAMAAGMFVMMTTWYRGGALLDDIEAKASRPLGVFFQELKRRNPPRVPGTAVFLSVNSQGAPPVLLQHLRHNRALHERVILLSMVTDEVPEVPEDQRVRSDALPMGFHRVKAHYGFMQVPDVQQVVSVCCRRGVLEESDGADTTYYVGRTLIVPTGRAPMLRWRKRLLRFMSRNASSATDFFNIPPDRVVELGTRVEF
jgi:KUP system potassium uptake protein